MFLGCALGRGCSALPDIARSCNFVSLIPPLLVAAPRSWPPVCSGILISPHLQVQLCFLITQWIVSRIVHVRIFTSVDRLFQCTSRSCTIYELGFGGTNLSFSSFRWSIGLLIAGRSVQSTSVRDWDGILPALNHRSVLLCYWIDDSVFREFSTLAVEFRDSSS